MYVPRVCAVVILRGKEIFDKRLGVSIPYSLGGLDHRGRWGIQGSRPADAVVLWATLQVIGTRQLGEQVDHSVALTRSFHDRLRETERLSPTHEPDLNLQVFRVGQADPDGNRLGEMQKRLTEAGRTWMSVSRWRSETLMRCVMLSPSLTAEHIEGFIHDIEQVAV
jgi:glutamate/tyrosine decarboxylase-like PLP-dependent enzyme